MNIYSYETQDYLFYISNQEQHAALEIIIKYLIILSYYYIIIQHYIIIYNYMSYYLSY